jgi:hypothetical protein
MRLGLVGAALMGVSLLTSGACSSKHDSSGAGSGGTKSGGSGGETTGVLAGKNSGGSGGNGAGAGGENAAGSGGVSGVDTTRCETASDCGYGEIDHEIVQKSDCLCLFGCPYIPLNKATIERRKASYAKLCDPTKDSQGKPCPIDDCVPLEAVVCDDHVCRAAPR